MTALDLDAVSYRSSATAADVSSTGFGDHRGPGTPTPAYILAIGCHFSRNVIDCRHTRSPVHPSIDRQQARNAATIRNDATERPSC
jgi:hypothetical protein